LARLIPHILWRFDGYLPNLQLAPAECTLQWSGMTNPIESATTEGSDEQLLPGDVGFHTAVVHLYRGEMQRMTVWRQRLDVTSNWAILLTVALTTFTLGASEVPHFTLLLGLALIGISVLIEGRRYRYLHHSGRRLYLIELGYFANVLQPSGTAPAVKWRSMLAEDLRRPRLVMSWFKATRVRLRRNYLLVLYFVTAAWITKLFIHPGRPASPGQFFDRLAVGELIPPWAVAVTAFTFVVGASVLAVTCPPAEDLEKWGRAFLEQPAQDNR
jgi:uncharacterized membrane protein